MKKIWITYSITRKALAARQGNLSSRTRERDVLSSGGMGKPSACAAQYMCRLLLLTDWQPKGVWTQGRKHWSVVRKCTLFLCHVLHRTSVCAAVAALALPSLSASPKAVVPHQAACTQQRLTPVSVKLVRELGQSECVREELSLFTFCCVLWPSQPALLWQEMPLGLGEIHGPV